MGYLPPETFRIKPFPDGDAYYIVYLAPSVDDLRATMRTCGAETDDDQLAACISATSDDEDHAYLVGIIFLPAFSGGGLVAHELAHAAFRIFDRQQTRVQHWERTSDDRTHETEEGYCLVLEHLTRDFWTHYYAGGHDQARRVADD